MRATVSAFRLRAQRRFEQVGLEQVFGFEPHTDALDEGQNLE